MVRICFGARAVRVPEWYRCLAAFAEAADVVCFISLARAGDIEMALILLKRTWYQVFSVGAYRDRVSLCAQRVSHF